MANVALVGLGNMGRGMAARLLTAGHRLNVYNRTAARADDLVRQGAQRFDSARAACDGADAVISMVSDDLASQALWTARDGILDASLAAQAFAIECSTLSHPWVMALSARCAARGLRYIDAPVTGLPESAARGALTLLVGASATDLQGVHGIVDCLAERIIHFGAVGTGTAYKLIINLMGAVQIASAAEGLAIAERAGLDLEQVAAAFATSQAASAQVVRNTRRMIANDHDRDLVFSAALRLKDVDYAVGFARALGIGSPLGSAAEALYRELSHMGHAALNESKIIDACRAQTVQPAAVCNLL